MDSISSIGSTLGVMRYFRTLANMEFPLKVKPVVRRLRPMRYANPKSIRL